VRHPASGLAARGEGGYLPRPFANGQNRAVRSGFSLSGFAWHYGDSTARAASPGWCSQLNLWGNRFMSVDLAHIRQVMAEADCLYTEEQVEAAIAKVAETINAELAERNPVVFCVMNGGLIFSGKLVPKLNFPLELSYLHATRYRNETSGGELFWKAKPEISFIDRDVLIIDDILDEGHTLGAIIDFCRHAGAAAVHTAVLIDKDHQRKARPDLKADYVGLSCIDRYIFGYGMDYKGYWRNAAGIYAVKGL
jgi:hypoxanthine phosphoribosyltransferase